MAIIRYVPSSRPVRAGQMVFDQVDLFLSDGETRSTGVLVADLQMALQVGATTLAWTLVTGSGVPDIRVAAGKVYWTETSPGFYSVRFFPHVVGLWRLILTYPAHDQVVSYSYDVSANNSSYVQGFKTSFTKR